MHEGGLDSNLFFLLFQTFETWDLYFDWKIDQRSLQTEVSAWSQYYIIGIFRNLNFWAKFFSIFWVHWKCKLPRVNSFELCNMDCFRELIFLIKEGLVKRFLWHIAWKLTTTITDSVCSFSYQGILKISYLFIFSWRWFNLAENDTNFVGGTI